MRKAFHIAAGLMLLLHAILAGAQTSTTLPVPSTQPGTAEEVSKAIADARALYEAKNYAKATDAARDAIALGGPPTPAALVLLGDCYLHQVLGDLENARRARFCFEQAVAKDQKYVPALRRLLELYQDDAEINPRGRLGEQWELVDQVASRLTVIDSNDREAWLAKHRATVERFIRGANISSRQVDDTVGGLTDLSTSGPFNADTVYYMLELRYHMGKRLEKTDDKRAGQIIAGVARQLDTLIDAHPNDAVMHYRAAQIMLLLSVYEYSATQQYKYPQRVQDELARAVELVKPDNSKYVEIKLFAGKNLESARKQDKAEQLYRNLLAERPGELTVRVALADLLARDPVKRNQVEKLIEEAPANDPGEYPGYKAYNIHRRELVALYDLINARLDRLPELKGKPEYASLLADIEAKYARMIETPGIIDSVLGLLVGGRIELVKARSAEAIPSFEQALKLVPTNPPTAPERELRDRLRFYLGSAYVVSGRDEDGINMLTPVVQELPDLVPARLLLAQALIRTKRTNEARVQVNALIRAQPDSPMVIRMQIALADTQTESEKIVALYKRLPETTLEQISEKFQTANYLGMKGESVRLLEMAYQAQPASLGIIVNLARAYANNGEKAKALALLDNVLASNPGNTLLQNARAEIANLK